MRKNIAIAVLIGIGAFLGYKYDTTKEALSARIRLRTGMTLEAQARCARGAEEFIKSDRFASRDMSPTYVAVYSPAFDKCYANIQIMNGQDNSFRLHRLVVDVFSGEYVAVCRWSWKLGDDPHTIRPFSCVVTDPTDPSKQLAPRSEVEFKRDIAPYLADR